MESTQLFGLVLVGLFVIALVAFFFSGKFMYNTSISKEEFLEKTKKSHTKTLIFTWIILISTPVFLIIISLGSIRDLPYALIPIPFGIIGGIIIALVLRKQFNAQLNKIRTANDEELAKLILNAALQPFLSARTLPLSILFITLFIITTTAANKIILVLSGAVFALVAWLRWIKIKKTKFKAIPPEHQEYFFTTSNKGIRKGIRIFIIGFIIYLVFSIVTTASRTSSSNNKYDVTDSFNKNPNEWTEQDRENVDNFFEWFDDTYAN